MILKERDKLMKEIRDTFDARLAASGIHELSRKAKSELLEIISSKIDYLYFPSIGLQILELMTVVLFLMRICIMTCTSFNIIISEHDSAELRALPKENLRQLTASICEILERYLDLEEEARLDREANAYRQEYRQENKENIGSGGNRGNGDSKDNGTGYRGSFTYTPAYAGAGAGAAASNGSGPGPGPGPAASNGPGASGESAATSAIADLQASVRNIESLIKRR